MGTWGNVLISHLLLIIPVIPVSLYKSVSSYVTKMRTHTHTHTHTHITHTCEQRLVLWNKAKLIIISDAVYAGWTRQIPDSKLLLCSIYDVLTQISDDFEKSCNHLCKPSFVPQMFSSFVFYLPPLSFCLSARLMSIMCTDERSLLCIMSRHAPYCWLATSLFWYSAPTPFSKAFLKKHIPHL